jgi:hypothetical protein
MKWIFMNRGILFKKKFLLAIIIISLSLNVFGQYYLDVSTVNKQFKDYRLLRITDSSITIGKHLDNKHIDTITLEAKKIISIRVIRTVPWPLFLGGAVGSISFILFATSDFFADGSLRFLLIIPVTFFGIIAGSVAGIIVKLEEHSSHKFNFLINGSRADFQNFSRDFRMKHKFKAYIPASSKHSEK